jgi:hypothetical protein
MFLEVLARAGQRFGQFRGWTCERMTDFEGVTGAFNEGQLASRGCGSKSFSVAGRHRRIFRSMNDQKRNHTAAQRGLEVEFLSIGREIVYDVHV